MMECPKCKGCGGVHGSCDACHGTGTLVLRSHVEIFTIYCRAAYRTHVFNRLPLAPIRPVAHSLGLTDAQADRIGTDVRLETDSIRRIINKLSGTAQSYARLKGVRVVVEHPTTHRNTIVTI